MISAFGRGGHTLIESVSTGSVRRCRGICTIRHTRRPGKAYAPFIDLALLVCLPGTLAALYERQSRQRSDCGGGALNTALTMMNATAIEQQALQVNRTATLNRAQTSAPADTFQTKDGWVLVQLGWPLFKRWANGEDHWLENSGLKMTSVAGTTVKSLAMAGQWCAERTTEQVLEMEASPQAPYSR